MAFANPWIGRFLPGFVLGFALKWLLNRLNEDSGSELDGAEEASSSKGRRRLPGAGERGRAGQSRRRPVEELKMVLVVNEELKMGKGKIGAQCAHAAVGLVEKLSGTREAVLLRHWEECGQAKVCLRAPDSQALRALAAAAREAGLSTYLVQDAGRTQVAPGSRTVLAIGPAGRSQVDQITGHLKLL